jgi:hypothetical protein
MLTAPGDGRIHSHINIIMCIGALLMDRDKAKPATADTVNGLRIANQIICIMRNVVRSVIAGLPR